MRCADLCAVRRILVVDDSAPMRTALARILQHEGYEVLTAADGVAGLEILRSHVVHGVVLDVYMPRMDGLETIRTLRALAPGLPVVLISGGNVRFPSYDPLAYALWQGASCVLHKPFAEADLVKALAALIAPEAVVRAVGSLPPS